MPFFKKIKYQILFLYLAFLKNYRNKIHIQFVVFTIIFSILCLFLPSSFHQKIMILTAQVIAGRVNCKLSISSMIFVRIFISECMEGIRTLIISIRTMIRGRKLYIDISWTLYFVLGQRPISLKLKRFSFTAHSKSTCFKRHW